MFKHDIKLRYGFWRYLVNLWTFLFLLFVVADFIGGNSLGKHLDYLAIIYVSALAIYAGTKEAARWYDYHSTRHPGEIFVFIWTVLLFILIGAGLLLNNNYVVPNAVISSYIAVITILAVTNRSKKAYQRSTTRKKRVAK